MLTVVGTTPSRTFRVFWALEELGLPYIRESEHAQSPAVFALNPLGQIPILKDDKTILTDSLAILHYLADRHDGLTYPPGSVERARMDARINFLLTEMEAPIWLMARHGFVLPKEHRQPGLRPLCEADFAFGEAKFAKLLGDATFFAGDKLTLADIIAAQIASWARNAKITLQPTTATYLARMEDRPAWQRALKD